MTNPSIRSCFFGALLISAVLWFTGLVTVPFANSAAKHWLVMVLSPEHERFAFWVYQLENIIYTIGRLPLLFACLIGIRIIETEKGARL